MLQTLKNLWYNNRRQLGDPRNIGLYIFALIVLAIAWSGARTIQTNYGLRKQISTLNQQNALYKLTNEDTALQNQYYQTDEYLDLAARENLGLAAPGETVEIVPKAVAMKYVDTSLGPGPKPDTTPTDYRSKYIKHLESWRDFLLGRKLFSD